MKAYKITGKLGDICSFVGGNEVKKGDMVYFHSESDMKQQCVAKQQEKRHEWTWMPAPIKTQWGHDMVVADLAIDKDHTVSVYCERDQTKKVEVMFSAQPQRQWVGLTHDERGRIWNAPENFERAMNFAIAIEAKLKELNT